MKKPPKIALVIFNTFTTSTSEFWGNLSTSILSGELYRRGVKNDIFLLLMQVGDAARNRRTLEQFVEGIRQGGYTMVWFDSLWLPEIKDMLRAAAPGTAVICRNEISEEFRGLPPDFEAAIRAALGPAYNEEAFAYQPNFQYIRFGASERIRQTLVDMMDCRTCSYRENLEHNTFYSRLTLKERRKYAGCSYCSVPPRPPNVSNETQKRVFLDLMRYYQKQLPHLERVSLPHPETFFDVLLELAPQLTSGEFRPVGFQMQLRPDVIVRRENDLWAILSAFKSSGFRVHLATVGFENFSESELKILNRGYEPYINTQALEIIRNFAEKFPQTIDMSRAIASFILFNPYTSMEDVEENLDQIAARDFGLFFRIKINKARIHPGVGLYALARREGLLVESKRDTHLLSDLPRGGYQGDYGYRFKDPKIAAVYDCYAEAERNVRAGIEQHEIYILKKIVESFKSHALNRRGVRVGKK